jgi:protein-disulfide isomerase
MRLYVAGALWLSVAFAAEQKVDKAALEAWVRHLFLWGAPVSVSVGDPQPAEIPGFFDVKVVASAGQARQQETFLVSADGRHIIRGTVYDVARNPFEGDLAKITTEGQPVVGPADAPVNLVIFSDLQCSYCAQAAKVLRGQILPAYPKDLRVVFKDMPLESIHPWARSAAVLGRCIQRQKPSAFWEFHDWIFGVQSEITPENLRAKVEEFAKSRGLDADGLATCAVAGPAAAEVEKSLAEARALRVDSTPTMFINGRRVVGSVAPEQLKNAIEHERDYARKQAR